MTAIAPPAPPAPPVAPVPPAPRAKAPTVTPPAPAPPRTRMKLAAVHTGKIEIPPAVVIYGFEGVGKSTFAASAPAPIFVCKWKETEQLDVSRFPEPTTWAEVLEAIQELATADHAYRTVVFDTLDWLESLCWTALCRKNCWANGIETPGWNKGQKAAVDEWRLFLAALERLREKRRMGVVFVGHATNMKYKNPEGEDYGRVSLKLDPFASGLFREWADAVLYAKVESFAARAPGAPAASSAKGVSTGTRHLRTRWSAAYDAKNRFDLPDPLPLSWADFADAVASLRPADVSALRAQVAALAGQLDEFVTATGSTIFDRAGFERALTAAGENPTALAALVTRLEGKVMQIQAQGGAIGGGGGEAAAPSASAPTASPNAPVN